MTGAGLAVLKRLANGAILVGERKFPFAWTYYLDTGSAITGMAVAGSTVARLLEANAITPLDHVRPLDDEVRYKLNAIGDTLLVAHAALKRKKNAKPEPQMALFDVNPYDTKTNKRSMD